MFKNQTPDQLKALADNKLQWHLTRLYGLWDELQKCWLNVNHQVMQDFLHFPEGTPIQDIHDWFESSNGRFCVDDVKQGVRLTPITSRADFIPVYDRNGLQVCFGDKLKAQICSGRYGQTRLIDAEVLEKHTLYGSLNSVQNGKVGSLFFNGHLIAFFDVGYKEFADFEHGHETWVEIIPA